MDSGSILPPMRKGASLLVYLTMAAGAFAQIDDDFWFVAPEVTSQHEDSPIQLRMATFDDPAEVVVSMPANLAFNPLVLSIPAGSATNLDLTPYLSVLENQPFNAVLDKGIHITSSSNISAYYEVGQLLNPDIFALKGKNALGFSFHLPFQTFTTNGYTASPSGFDVVATEDNTTLTITPTQDLVGHPAGIPFQVVLPMAGSTYSARAAGTGIGNHAVGTKVSSDRPVAVTMHDDSCNGTLFGGCADLMGDQLVPDNILGTEYIAVHGYLAGDDRIQIVATQNNTLVQVDGAVLANLQAGEAYEHVLNTPSAFIETSEPAAVWQSTGFGCELGGAQLPSVKCTGSTSTVFVRSTNETMRLNVLVPAGGEGDFLFNGTSGIITASMFAIVPGNPNWMFAQVTTLEGQITTGQATRIENTSTVFHLGIINGGANSGTRYGYFSDYGALKYQAVNQVLHPCLGDPLTLEVDPIENGLYQWTGPGNFTSTGLDVNLGLASLSDSGLYVVQGFTGECAIENDTIEVIVHQPLGDPVLSEDVETCEGVTVTLGSDIANVSWTGPGGFASDGQYVVITNTNVDDSGVYIATVVDPYCPAGSDSVAVSIVQAEDLAVTWDDVKEFCPGQEKWITLPGELAVDNPSMEWWWQPDDATDPVLISTEYNFLVQNTGTYYGESTTSGPCGVTSTGIVEVVSAECDLLVPNIITPGNDDLNNRFVVPNLGQFPDSYIRIFNRWGAEVFFHEDFGSTFGWLPGDELSDGVYYYILHIARGDEQISVTTIDGTTLYTEPGPIEIHGSITVIK